MCLCFYESVSMAFDPKFVSIEDISYNTNMLSVKFSNYREPNSIKNERGEQKF